MFNYDSTPLSRPYRDISHMKFLHGLLVVNSTIILSYFGAFSDFPRFFMTISVSELSDLFKVKKLRPKLIKTSKFDFVVKTTIASLFFLKNISRFYFSPLLCMKAAASVDIWSALSMLRSNFDTTTSTGQSIRVRGGRYAACR